MVQVAVARRLQHLALGSLAVLSVLAACAGVAPAPPAAATTQVATSAPAGASADCAPGVVQVQQHPVAGTVTVADLIALQMFSAGDASLTAASDGWQYSGRAPECLVSFRWHQAGHQHELRWEANLQHGTVTPLP
jgi:hypothetical protein